MTKFYKLHTVKLKNTIEIATEFANACEAARPRDEIWNVALYGIPQIGKSEFSKAFANAALKKILLVEEQHEEKMHDYTGVINKTQIRIGDYASNRGPSGETEPAFMRLRKDGYGGYDMLEHAPGDYPQIARIVIAYAARGRDIIMHVEDKLADTPVFEQFVQKFNARQLNLD